MKHIDPDTVFIERERFLQFVAEQQKFISDMLSNETTTSWAPMLTILAKHIETGQEQCQILAVVGNFNEADEKYLAMRGVGRHLWQRKLFPEAIVFTSEAWASTQDRDAPRIQPRQDANRREIIQLSAIGVLPKKDGKPQKPLAAINHAEITRLSGERMRLGAWGGMLVDGEKDCIVKPRLLSQVLIGVYNSMGEQRGTNN